MSHCERLNGCPMPLEEGVGPVYKKHYCTAGFTACARFQVLKAAGPGNVPRWLKPNMNAEGDKIIATFLASSAEPETSGGSCSLPSRP